MHQGCGAEEGTVLVTPDAGLGAVGRPVGAHHPNQPHLGAQPSLPGPATAFRLHAEAGLLLSRRWARHRARFTLELAVGLFQPCTAPRRRLWSRRTALGSGAA